MRVKFFFFFLFLIPHDCDCSHTNTKFLYPFLLLLLCSIIISIDGNFTFFGDDCVRLLSYVSVKFTCSEQPWMKMRVSEWAKTEIIYWNLIIATATLTDGQLESLFYLLSLSHSFSIYIYTWLLVVKGVKTFSPHEHICSFNKQHKLW